MGFNKKEYNKQFKKTPIGRAGNILCSYNRNDKKYNRGKGDLTARWIMDNIFPKPCTYCGKSGWEIMGCNRIDDSKPHTKDNVEPCCKACNDKLGGRSKSKRVDQISPIDGEVVKTYSSIFETHESGFWHGDIIKCLNGLQETHKGYIWKRPL